MVSDEGPAMAQRRVIVSGTLPPAASRALARNVTRDPAGAVKVARNRLCPVPVTAARRQVFPPSKDT